MFTEKYVSVAGGGAHDGTSEANAWTFAEMIAAAPAAGNRVNVISGNYSVGAYTLGTGTAAAPFVIRGYNVTIGDLDNQGRNADGTLNTTNFPAITITSAWTPAAFSVLQNLNITAALSTAIITSATVDDFSIISCNVVNTQNNASARGVTADDRIRLFNSDFSCTGAAHGIVVAVSTASLMHTCRFHGTDTDVLLSMNDAIVVGCVFYGNASSIGIDCTSQGTILTTVIGCTFYGIGTCVRLPNAANVGVLVFINNCATDSSAWISSQYSATANMAAIEMNNRTRDVTTLLTGIEPIAVGEVTTDTGGPETDYVDAAAGNFRLISTSPAVGVALTPYMSMGAYQLAAGGGGGGVIVPVIYQGVSGIQSF